MTNIYARQHQLIMTTEEWTESDLVIGKGEIALEQQASGGVGIKIGDGVQVFSALPYWVSPPVAEELEITNPDSILQLGAARIVRLKGNVSGNRIIRIEADSIVGESGRLITMINNSFAAVELYSNTNLRLRLKDRQIALLEVGMAAIIWQDYSSPFTPVAHVLGISGRSNQAIIFSSASTIAINYAFADYWCSASVTKDVTIVAPTQYMSRGSPLTISLTQDSVGGHTATWPEEIRVSTVFDPTPGATTTWQFIYTDEFWTEMGSGTSLAATI